jgi:hypothetical protein
MTNEVHLASQEKISFHWMAGGNGGPSDGDRAIRCWSIPLLRWKVMFLPQGTFAFCQQSSLQSGASKTMRREQEGEV